MKESREIKALLHLIDDPDENVYSTVSEKILSFGKAIVPNLESLWENVADEETQERIELLIHRVHFRDLVEEFQDWKNDSGSLLEGAMIVAKYNYPELDKEKLRQEIEKMRRNTWLELNNYLTPMETVNVINSIFFNYYKHKGIEIAYDNPDHFLINKALETRKGNAFGNGIIYLIICQLLDVPIMAVNIPRQFLLGFFDNQYDLLNVTGHPSEKIKFYIDVLTGQMYSNKDLENYFKRLSVPPVASYFKPLNNNRIIWFLLDEMSKCYADDRNRYKREELQMLANILDT